MTVREIQDPALTGWHLDKRVPIALILAIGLQATATIFWAAKIDQRVSQLEADRMQMTEQPGKIIRLETQMQGLQDGMRDVCGKLDRLLEKAGR